MKSSIPVLVASILLLTLTIALAFQITSLHSAKPITPVPNQSMNIVPSLLITGAIFHCTHDDKGNTILKCVSGCEDIIWQTPSDGAIHLDCPDCCKEE